MKVIHCDHCQNLVFFENLRCANCGHDLAFVPALGSVTALKPAQQAETADDSAPAASAGDAGGSVPDDVPAAVLWQRALPGEEPEEQAPRLYRKCRNYGNESVCNWAVDADDPSELCISCRLTHTIPALDVPGNSDAWFRLESAKRRLIYSLLAMGLPIRNKVEEPASGVTFDFLADLPVIPAGGFVQPVLTGHEDGRIVINIAEADDAERERRRVQMHEPYRTLLGHLRHEIGHYYWDRLIRDSDRLEIFRAQFGDERQDYAGALQAYYANGAPLDWQQHYVSAYASAHPWEDWAETWAHYLHITDTIETADASGLALHPPRGDEPALMPQPLAPNPSAQPFEQMIERWFPLTYLLNNLNRGLGLADAYPFVLSMTALEKLSFVHETLALLQQAPAAAEAQPQEQTQSQSQTPAAADAGAPPAAPAASPAPAAPAPEPVAPPRAQARTA